MQSDSTNVAPPSDELNIEMSAPPLAPPHARSAVIITAQIFPPASTATSGTCWWPLVATFTRLSVAKAFGDGWPGGTGLPAWGAEPRTWTAGLGASSGDPVAVPE